MIRRLLKSGIARAVSATRADRLIATVAGRDRLPVILGYHRVVVDFEASARAAIPPMLTSARMLESHLDWIGRRYRFVSLDELGSWMLRGGPIDPPLAAVTFDDGYSDVYHHAFPLLKRKGIPAAVFVVTGLVDTEEPPVHDRLYRLMSRLGAARSGRGAGLHPLVSRYADLCGLNGSTARLARDPLGATRAFLGRMPRSRLLEMIESLEAEHPLPCGELDELRAMSGEMIREMAREGVTIGSHTRTHVLLTHESRVRIVDEVAGSRADLEGLIGSRVHHFAYPDGRFNSDVLEILAVSGYRFAYTTCRHRDPVRSLLTIPRMLLWQNSCLDSMGRFSWPVLSCQVSSLFDPASSCALDHR